METTSHRQKIGPPPCHRCEYPRLSPPPPHPLDVDVTECGRKGAQFPSFKRILVFALSTVSSLRPSAAPHA